MAGRIVNRTFPGPRFPTQGVTAKGRKMAFILSFVGPDAKRQAKRAADAEKADGSLVLLGKIKDKPRYGLYVNRMFT